MDTNQMKIVYTPKKPRYIVRENGEPEDGYNTLGEATRRADRLQRLFPYNTYDVVDERPEE